MEYEKNIPNKKPLAKKTQYKICPRSKTLMLNYMKL